MVNITNEDFKKEFSKAQNFISSEITTRGGMEYYQGDWKGLLEGLVKQYPNDTDLGREIRKLLIDKE